MKGSVVSKGIAIGQVKRIQSYVEIGFQEASDLEYEIHALGQTKESVVDTLKYLQEKTERSIGKKEAEIFGAHQMIIEDPTLLPQIVSLIKSDKRTAASAVEKVMSDMEVLFKSMDSEYMRERALDIYDIKKRWIKHLKGEQIDQDLKEPVILVAEDLTPSDTLELDLDLVAGLLMEKGGLTSHTSILAQSMDIPAIVGCGPLDLQDHKKIILDATEGKVIVDFDDQMLVSYQELLEKQVSEKEALKAYINQQAITLDHKHVEVACNIAGKKDVKDLLEVGADGVGLFRTEFVYMNRSAAPSEEEQFKIYADIVKGLMGKPIIFRTMDIGGDKEVDYLHMPKEENPFLGYRAIRYCLDEIEFFKTQIRAILRTTVYGPVKIMFPMIGNIQQFKKAKAIVKEVEASLIDNGIEVSNYELGIMVEIPSAAIQARQLAKHVDFFSIGTNDLTQYTVAVDRQNEKVGDLYDYFDPAVLTLIRNVIEAGKESNTYVGMCGSAAGDTMMIPLLVSWGITELSMASTQALKAKKIIQSLDTNTILSKTDQIFEMDDHHQVRAFLNDYYLQVNLNIS